MAAAVVAGGFLMAGEWEARVKILLLFRQMMVYLKSRILYSNETLPEALKEVGTRFADEKSGMEAEAGLFFPESGKSGWRKNAENHFLRYGKRSWTDFRRICR